MNLKITMLFFICLYPFNMALTSFELLQNFLHNNINVIDSDMLKQTGDIIALFKDESENEKCYELDMKSEINQKNKTKIQLELEIDDKKEQCDIELETALVKKCDKLKEKDCHMLFTPLKKNGNLVNLQQASIFKLYPSQQEKLTSSEMILQRVLFEYQLISPRPFLWTCTKNPIDQQDEQMYNIQRRFISLENVITEYEESFMTEEELNKRLLMSSIILKKVLILIQNIGGIRQYQCLQKDKINEQNEIRKTQFIDSLQRLMIENQSQLQESPLDYLMYFEPNKFFKLCQNNFFQHNPIFLSELELNSFSFSSEKLIINLQNIQDQKLTIDWQEAVNMISNRHLLVKKIIEKIIESTGELQDGKIQKNSIIEITDMGKIARTEDNIGLILKEVIHAYTDIIQKLFEDIKFSPLIIPKFHYGQDSKQFIEKQDKLDFHDIMLKFEQNDTKKKDSDEQENNDEEEIDIKYRKHFILRIFLKFMQKFFNKYISKDLELFNCLKPYTKFQYDNCPEFMQDMITEIDTLSNKQIQWSQIRDLIFGYVFSDADQINIDIEKFINNIFIYAREKLQQIKESKQEKINLKELIEGVIEFENLKLENLQRIASVQHRREII